MSLAISGQSDFVEIKVLMIKEFSAQTLSDSEHTSNTGTLSLSKEGATLFKTGFLYVAVLQRTNLYY